MALALVGQAGFISIHAPRGGSDLDGGPKLWVEKLFQSTLPVGGATLSSISFLLQMHISIHAPRGGSDRYAPWCFHYGKYFNPRSPWGERQFRCAIL